MRQKLNMSNVQNGKCSNSECFKCQKPRMSNAQNAKWSICQMLNMPNAKGLTCQMLKVLYFQIPKCSKCQMLKVPMFKVQNDQSGNGHNHPWAILLFYDTHDISRYFNMMQYIAIFSRYFPGVKLVKKMCNFLQMLSWEHSCWDFATKTPYFVFLRQKWPNLCFSAKKNCPT